jgi:hypothetical protein
MFRVTDFCCFILCIVLLTGCKNDLELNAPYKEIPTIYAVLNPQDPIQVIRINKVFLGEGDANVMAKVHDSVNYQPGELTVTLDRFLNGTQTDAAPNLKTITFTEDVVSTAEGAFNTTQRVYKTDKQLFTFGEYRLTVKNNSTGNVFTARTNALDSVNANQGYFPIHVLPKYPYPPDTPPEGYVNFHELERRYQIRFTPLGREDLKYVGAPQVYNLVMRMFYIDSMGTQGNQERFIDYSVGTKYVRDFTKQGHINWVLNDFFGKDVFVAAGVALRRNNVGDKVIGRRLFRVDFIIYSTSQEYLDYLQYTQPSTSISQQTPLYSNFDNRAALGLFTFRNRSTVYKQPSNDFINEFSRNPNTCSFRFFNSNLVVPGCTP